MLLAASSMKNNQQMTLPEIKERQDSLFNEQWKLEIERPHTDGHRRFEIDTRLSAVRLEYERLEQISRTLASGRS